MPDPARAWDSLRASWLRSLRARNLTDKPVSIYDSSALTWLTYLATDHPRLLPVDTRSVHVEGYLAWYASGRAPAYISQRYRALQQWFGWMVAQDEITADPTARMHAPVVPERPVPVLTDDQLRALLESCAGRRLVDRRDLALFRLAVDTGGRLTEISSLQTTDDRRQTTDVDLDLQCCRVPGKGRQERVLPIGVRTTEALDRYLRARAADKHAPSPGLWLGERGKGPLTANGVYQLVKRRGRAVGLGEIHPHQFRHTASHRWLAEGGSETDLMQLNGWKSRSMLQRYAASAAAERARDAHRRMGLGDRL